MHFQRVEIVTLCVCVRVCVLFWFLSPRQAATTSYPALIYFRAVHRNGTNQEGRNTHTQKQQQQGKKIQTTSFGTDVQLLSSSNKQ